MRLHHLALGARDVERVAAFYRETLGLPELVRHRDGEGRLRSVWLGLAGAVLMVEATREECRRVEGIGAGPFLVAFAVDAAGRAGLERRIAEAGFPVESRTTHTSYFRDPEGNRVAVSTSPLPKT